MVSFEEWVEGCQKRGSRGGHKKAPPGSGGAPHYYLPTQIFRPCAIPGVIMSMVL